MVKIVQNLGKYELAYTDGEIPRMTDEGDGPFDTIQEAETALEAAEAAEAGWMTSDPSGEARPARTVTAQ